MNAPLRVTEWLALLENRHPHEIWLGLSRIRQAAKLLKLDQSDVPVMTVAGTNGKGSTVAALEAIYHAAGYRVGSYTSPHLLKFNERIRVALTPIPDEQLCMAFHAIESARGEIHLTYFEMATLAALFHFKAAQVDLILLEVGMGGRLDATNLLDADLAIITTVDFDHQAYLGDTKEAIGFEKSGILRRNQLFVYADFHPPTTVLSQARALNTEMYCLGEDYSYTICRDQLQISYGEGKLAVMPLPSIHPKAAAAAVVATHCFSARLPITDAFVQAGLKNVFLLGRQHAVVDKFTTIYDVAHNPQAVLELAEFVSRKQGGQRIFAVFAALKDKDLRGLIQPMLPLVDAWFLAGLTCKRGADEQTLKEIMNTISGDEPNCFSDPASAYHEARQQAGFGDLIIVYGSFFTVGAVWSVENDLRES